MHTYLLGKGRGGLEGAATVKQEVVEEVSTYGVLYVLDPTFRASFSCSILYLVKTGYSTRPCGTLQCRRAL